MTADPTLRFSNRVDHYVRARPRYPAALLDFCRKELMLTSSSRIADIGSGTGILSELFLQNGNPVFGVEPNDQMRSAGERSLSNSPRFHSINGTAEATTLPDASVDFVTAGQAFHWFDAQKTRAEFNRILVPNGWVLLIWNERRLDRPPFSIDYERIIRKYQVDLDAVHRKNVTSVAEHVLGKFFGPGGFALARFDNTQDLNYEGVEDRVLSSSYMPLPDDPRCGAMLKDLKGAFEKHQRNGGVQMEYDTNLYYGRMG